MTFAETPPMVAVIAPGVAAMLANCASVALSEYRVNGPNWLYVTPPTT